MNELNDNILADEMFNPSEYTEKELLKLVYRELHTLRAEFDDYRKNNTVQKDMSEMAKRITVLETEVSINKKLVEESEKRFNRVIVTVGVILTGLGLALKFL